MEQAKLERVLVACRGATARRLLRHYRERGVETCVVFSEADADQPYLDEADYAVFLNGRSVASTYLDPQRVVAAAMDAGCDAIHPGTGFLAEDIDLHSLANQANVAVIGCDPSVLARVVDPAALAEVARELSLPVVPVSGPLSPTDDGMLEAARIGAPLLVRPTGGGAPRRIIDLAELPAALDAVRGEAVRATGEARVRLERAVDVHREIGVVVAADRHGRFEVLGLHDASLGLDGATWVEEAGPELFPELREPLCDASAALARALRWVGVGEVRWALGPRGGWFLRGFSARLPEAFDLVEEVWGVDLVEAQFEALSGGALGWEAAELEPRGHGLQLRVRHLDPSTRARPEGVVASVDLPPGVAAELGVEAGCCCSEESEPLLARVTVVAPTRGAAVVKAKAAAEATEVAGVPTNVPHLRELLGDESFWRGEHDTHTVERLLGARG